MGKHVALYSVPRVPKQYTSSIQAVPRLVAQDLHKEWPSSTSAVYKECPTAVAPVYKKWPSSSSSVQVMSKLVHMLCTNWALAWALSVYISKQFPSLGTLSVTAWTQLVHICEQVSFQVGTPTFTAVCKSSCIDEININDVTCSCYYVLLILAPPPSKGDVLEQVMVVLNGQ